MFPPLRSFLLRLFGAKIGKDCVIHDISLFNVYHNGFSNLTVGNNCFLGNQVMLDLAGAIYLEDHVTIANRSMILTHINVGYKNHPLQKYYPKKIAPVRLKRGCFVGAGTIIFPGITLGQESVIGAGSVVRDNVLKKTVVAGNPAKFFRKLQ